MSKVAKVETSTKISRTSLVGLIETTAGSVIRINFKTKTGADRQLVGNKVAGKPTALGYMRFNDFQKKGIRSVDPKMLSAAKIKGVSYKVK